MHVLTVKKISPIDDISVRPGTRPRLAGLATSAVATEMHDGRLELAQFVEQVQRLGGPARHQLESVSMTASLKCHLDRARLLV
jgi:hypothetical protein